VLPLAEDFAELDETAERARRVAMRNCRLSEAIIDDFRR
jgi:hypothetical protein